MKIISQGEDPAKKVIQAKCSHCGTVVEFEQSEAKLVSDQREGDFYQIGCPVCHHTITKATS